jgi:hypothetical protein
MFERQWLAVPPRLLTSDGGIQGQIKVADTAGFKVKAQVVIGSTSQNQLLVEVKRVLSKTEMAVGPIGKNINERTNLSAFTLTDTAYVYQDIQARVNISPQDIVQAVYEQEPVVAIRTTSVDQYGNPYNIDNPIPIVFDGTIAIGKVEVQGTNGNIIEPNPDGSINVNIIPSTSATNVVKNTFGAISGIMVGVTTSIVTYTVPINKTALLQRSTASGENISTYTLSINGLTQSIQRTYYAGGFNVNFDFTTGQENGILLHAGDIVRIEVLNNGNVLANFDARIQVFEILT